MIIRQEQIDVFAAAARQRREAEAAAHVSQFAPEHTEALGEQGTRSVVRLGIARAGKYGFTDPGPVHFYLELMFLLGSEFDSDRQYAWAAQTLKDAAIPGQMPRADCLYERAIQYFDSVAGPDNQFAREAVEKLKAFPAGSLAGSQDVAGGEVINRIQSALKAAWPQKAGYLGDPELRALIERAAARAKARGLASGPAAWSFTVLEFTLGHAFERDPLYPWIASALRDSEKATPEDTVRRLYRETILHLDRAAGEQVQHA